jgi:SAP domain
VSLYARSDMMSVSIPETSGGCGKTHSRPVAKGVARKVWELTCPSCESYLRGDHKPKVIKVVGGDKNKGIPSRMDHVPDSDPHWSSTPEAIPQTPDEDHIYVRRQETATQQLHILEAAAAAKAAGFPIPEEAVWLIQERLGSHILQGKIECMNGHANDAGNKFCGECSVDMKKRAAIDAPVKESFNEFEKLSIKQLRELCKAEGLPASGTKKQLVERLS